MEHEQETRTRTSESTETVGPTQYIPLPIRTPLHPILQLQQSIGNRALQRLLADRNAPLQPVGTADGLYKREASGTADQVTGTPAHMARVQLLPQSKVPAHIHEAAAAGTSGPSSTLPYLDRIQQSFGRHDVSRVRAHQDLAAAEAAAAMGAQAFACGDDVGFAASPSLRTAAHEAAHVVQQRGGVELLGGVDEADDAHERHADAVAELVVQGRSSEALLDAYAPTEHEEVPPIQRRKLFRQVQRKPDDPPSEKKIRFRITFDKPLTRDQLIDLAERTIYGHPVHGRWTNVKEKYAPSDSPVWATVPASSLQGSLKDYGEAVGKVIKGIDQVQDAATYQRLYRIIQKLTPAQWADFEKRITSKTDNLDDFEKAVDAYLAAQQKREAELAERDRLVTKLHGLEALYKEYKDWKSFRDQVGVIPSDLDKSFSNNLKANGFSGGVTEFEKYIQDYLSAFRSETVRIGLDILQQYDSVLYKENERYQDAAAVAALHQKLAPLRAEYPEFEKNASIYNEYVRNKELSRVPGSGHLRGTTTEAEAEAAREAAEKHKAAARESVVSISGDFPVLKEEHLPLDRRLDKAAMAKADPGQLSALLKSHIQARRDDIKKTKETLTTEPEKVFSLDNLLELSLQRQGVDPKSILGQIVRDKASAIKTREAIIGFLIGVFAIALTIVSLGTGIVAVGAAVGAAAISSFLAYQEFKEYETRHAAYGTGLLSDDPSLVWVIVAVAGAALDLGQAIKAVRTISPLAKTLEATGDVAKFTEGLKALEKAGEIDAKIARATEQAGLARTQAAEAAKSLSRTLMSRPYSFPGPLTDPDVYKDVVKLAYYKVKAVGYDFLKFAAEVQLARTAAKLGDLTTEERLLLKKAYEEGKAFGTEEELLKYLKQTHPMGPPDPTAVPKGKRTPINPADDAATKRSLARENDAADILSQKGYVVEQNPKVPGPSNPDYLIEGKVFDCYAPTEKKSARGIWSYIKEEKLDKGQTTRVVLNLQDWGGDIAALKKQFHDWPMAGLDEVIVIMKDKSIFHLVP